ncbi:DUF6326 family protein [Patescibacteria group bacterium]
MGKYLEDETMKNRKVIFSWLWVFVMFNYTYADILTLMDPSVLKELITGSAGGLQMTPEFLFMGAILMEIPIAMIILSRILKYKANRIANIVAGVIKTLAVFASMFVGTPTSYYLFFGVIEIATTIFIVWYAWTWTKQTERR